MFTPLLATLMRCALLGLVLLLAGCAAEPVPYHSGNEIPQGPGLLTGEDGALVLSAEEWRQYQEWRKSKK